MVAVVTIPTVHLRRLENDQPRSVLTQLSQLGEKSEQYQCRHSGSFHYTALAGRRAMFSGAVIRGGFCRGRSSLSRRARSFLVGGEFGVTAEDQGAAVGGGEMDVEHLDRCKLVEHSSRREAGRQRLEPCTQRDVQAVGQEGDEYMRLDAVLELMMDRAQVQIVLHGLEGGLDLDELDIEPPQLRRLPPGEIGAQQIAAFPPPHLAQLVAIEREAETGALGSDLNIDQTPCRPCSGARGAELHEKFLAIEVHGGDLLEPRP